MIDGALTAPKSPRRPRRGLAAVLLAFGFGCAGAVSFADGAVIAGKAVVAQALLERAWEKTLAGESEVRPWGWADVWPVLKIEAPRLGKSAIVLSGVSGEAMAFGPGLMTGPNPGEAGLAIIAAHRDTHFRFLKDVKIGDAIVVTGASGETLMFRIVETRIVKADRSGLYVDGDAAQIALVTCWPFDAQRRGDDRFVAIADLQARGGAALR